MRALGVSLLAASSLWVTIANVPAAESSPARTLVYSFERSIDENVSVETQPSPQDWQQQVDAQKKAAPRQDLQFAAPGEEVPQSAGRSAQSAGTIEVDVLREQTDRGLVVSIREQGNGAPPATCVVYPNTSLTCDSQQNVNPEEYALLRFLGRGFVDPSQMDAQHRWHVAQNGGGLDSIADYQIVGNTEGTLTIAESQTIGSKGMTTATIRSTIGYDFNRSLPTSIDERVVQNQQGGTQETARSVHTVLRLVSAAP